MFAYLLRKLDTDKRDYLTKFILEDVLVESGNQILLDIILMNNWSFQKEAMVINKSSFAFQLKPM